VKRSCRRLLEISRRLSTFSSGLQRDDSVVHGNASELAREHSKVVWASFGVMRNRAELAGTSPDLHWFYSTLMRNGADQYWSRVREVRINFPPQRISFNLDRYTDEYPITPKPYRSSTALLGVGTTTIARMTFMWRSLAVNTAKLKAPTMRY
jgi:hypothetical protein